MEKKGLVAKSVKMPEFSKESVKTLIEKHKRRLGILQKEVTELTRKHGSLPTKEYTYWGGWDVGYLKGRIITLEDAIEDLTDILQLLEKYELNENVKKST
ncbi:hypothetical protein EalM132_00109 [Exiguobacterium phage vB_EalM-132]|nr:hypothetical protein EalM132_00109 [Exiguobacterium phage vB_EalM-132]